MKSYEYSRSRLSFDIGQRSFTYLIQNFIFSETTSPIKAKFYMWYPKEGETKVCINGPGQMNKMAAMPIMWLNPLKINFSGIGGPVSMKLCL